MTHYIICDTALQGKNAAVKGNHQGPPRLISPRSLGSFEGTRLFPGDTFEDASMKTETHDPVWAAISRHAVKAKVALRYRAGWWHAIPNADHPILKVDPLLDAVRNERVVQLRKWGEQHHEFRREGMGSHYRTEEKHYKRLFDRQNGALAGGGPTWDVILLEEVYEALAEDDPKRRVEELIQVAAVALAIAEDLESGS